MSTATAPRNTTARLEARISTDLHRMLKRAAELEGRTVTDFVVAAVHSAAQTTIEKVDVIRLAAQDQQRFAQALMEPPAPNAALQSAFARHNTLIKS